MANIGPGGFVFSRSLEVRNYCRWWAKKRGFYCCFRVWIMFFFVCVINTFTNDARK